MTPSQMPEKRDSSERPVNHTPTGRRNAGILRRLFYSPEVSFSPMALIMGVFLLLSLIAFPLFSLLMYSGKPRDGIEYCRASTRSHLAEICMLIQTIEAESKSVGCHATTLPELVDWIGASDAGKWYASGREGVDLQNKVICDYWKQPIHLIVRKGQLEALGSAGENKTWENSQGDDIAVNLADVGGPAKQGP